MPRTLAGLPNSQAVGYTQSNRRALAGLEALAHTPAPSASLQGLGDANLVMSVPQIAGTAATGIIGGGVSAGTIAATSAWATIGIPVIGAAVVGVTLWLSAMYKRGAQKEAATNIVNQIEEQLKANLAGYQSGPRTPASQLQALANFDAGWQAVLENCGNKELGSAGERCISERERGGTAPWCPKPGGMGCDWFALYRDPIANDIPVENVQTLNTTNGSGAGTVGGSIQNVVSTLTEGSVQVGGMNIPYLLIGGVMLLMVAMKGSSK